MIFQQVLYAAEEKLKGQYAKCKQCCFGKIMKKQPAQRGKQGCYHYILDDELSRFSCRYRMIIAGITFQYKKHRQQ